MFKIILWLVRWWMVLVAGWFVPLAQQVIVDTPRPGEAVQGQVTIAGNVDLEGFQSYEVSFAYQRDDTNTWFLIGKGDQIVRGGTLATWDTTTITDGQYRIRVRVYLSEGRMAETIVQQVRVRNYTPIETSTPVPQGAVGSQKTITAPGDYTPSGVKGQDTVPANPLEISSDKLQHSFLLGGIVAIGLFILLGGYFLLQVLFRKGG
jgi:hypothetical protein